MSRVIALIPVAALALTGCYSGALKGDDGSKLRLVGGVMVVCETMEGTLAGFGVAASYETCPHDLDPPPPDSDTAPDTADPVDTSAQDTGTVEAPEDNDGSSEEGGICGFYTEIFDNPAFCQPWRVQANSPANAHTLNVWFDGIEDRGDLTGAVAPEAILAHCPDPNGIEPTTATALEGSIEVTRDNGRKATVKLDTNRGSGKLKFQVCR